VALKAWKSVEYENTIHVWIGSFDVFHKDAQNKHNSEQPPNPWAYLQVCFKLSL